MDDERVPTRRMRAANSVDEAPRRHEPGDRVGPWIIGERVGGGGFGDVYAATHHASRMPAALKVLHAHFVASSEMLARFDREVEVLSRLRHPNVVRVIDAGFDDSGRPYFAMERLVGRDLGTILAARQRLGTAEVRRIIEPLCETLAFAHELGIVHRDLKASNVFVCDADQRVVLLDFGIAKLSDALMPELTASHQSLGTPGCMAPEQIHGGRVDARTDIYALGGLLFLLLTGRMPFSDPSETMTQYLHMHARRPRASALVPVPAEVDDVIVRAMAIQPGDRYAEARALLEAVRSALREAPQPIATTVEHSAIFLWIDNLGDDDELDEGLIADLERVLPAVERQLGEQGFALALDLGTSALFLAPGREPASAVRTAVAVWDALESRAGRDPRVRVGLCVHRGVATVTGHRIEPCALLRPETWGMPEQLVGVWVTNAIEPALRRVR